MSGKKIWCPWDGMSFLALTAMCGVLTAALAYAAPCDQACGPWNNALCNGPAVGSCPFCAVTSLACTTSPGKTVYTGNATRANTPGTDDINFVPIPCRIHIPCKAGAPITGRCDVNIFLQLTCVPDAFSICNRCIDDTPIVVRVAMSCEYVPGCHPPF